MLNRIPISLGTSLLAGAGRARPGCLLGAIEALIEQANAQTLHDHPDTTPNLLSSVHYAWGGLDADGQPPPPFAPTPMSAVAQGQQARSLQTMSYGGFARDYICLP